MSWPHASHSDEQYSAPYCCSPDLDGCCLPSCLPYCSCSKRWTGGSSACFCYSHSRWIHASPRVSTRATRLLRRHGRRLIRSACRLRCHYTLPAEYAGLGGGRDRGASVVCGCEVLFVLAGHVFVPRLRGQRFGVVLVLRDFFFVRGTGRNAALAAVEGHVILVHDHCLVVDSGHIGDVGHAAVVVERASAPVSASEAETAVAVAVIDSAVEADVRTPITTMPSINTVRESPVARSPQQAYRCYHPGTGHPVVASIVIPSPVAGRPHIAGAGSDGLGVDGQSRRSDTNRDPDSDLRERGGGKGQHHDCENQPADRAVHCHCFSFNPGRLPERQAASQAGLTLQAWKPLCPRNWQSASSRSSHPDTGLSSKLRSMAQVVWKCGLEKIAFKVR